MMCLSGDHFWSNLFDQISALLVFGFLYFQYLIFPRKLLLYNFIEYILPSCLLFDAFRNSYHPYIWSFDDVIQFLDSFLSFIQYLFHISDCVFSNEIFTFWNFFFYFIHSIGGAFIICLICSIAIFSNLIFTICLQLASPLWYIP